MKKKLLILGAAVVNGQQCHLCPNGVKGITNPRLVVNDKTCLQWAAEKLKMKQYTPGCENKEIRLKCCNVPPPAQLAVKPPKVEWKGPHPACNICRNGEYPQRTSMVINVLYIGEGSCAQYYVHGLEGKIPQHLCSAIQYFAWSPCECPESKSLTL